MGCSTKERIVTVPEIHTVHHWHTDSLRERDSTHTEHKTIIREVDSAAMAQYGIQMERNQRAWLIMNRELYERVKQLEHMTVVKDTVHDSIPVPVPMPAPQQANSLTTIDRVLFLIAVSVLVAYFIFLITVVLRKKN